MRPERRSDPQPTPPPAGRSAAAAGGLSSPVPALSCRAWLLPRLRWAEAEAGDTGGYVHSAWQVAAVCAVDCGDGVDVL